MAAATVSAFELEGPPASGTAATDAAGRRKAAAQDGAGSRVVALAVFAVLAVGVLVGICGFAVLMQRHRRPAPSPPPVGPQGELMRDDFDAAAFRILSRMGLAVLLDESHYPMLIGRGYYGRVYAVPGDKVLKVQLGAMPGEALIGQALPDYDHLTKFYQIGEVEIKDKTYCGMLMRRDTGVEIHKRAAFPNPRALLIIAADIAVALHAMHSKVQGHVVLHCDLVPKNVLAHDVGDGLGRATLVDYGLSLAGALHGVETPMDKLFWYNTDWHHCRGTNWTAADWGAYAKGVRPYSAAADWRELGLMLYALAEDHGRFDLRIAEKGIQGNIGGSCTTRCALERTLDASKKLQEPLLGFVKYLVLEHDHIEDEVSDVLGHSAFADVHPSPATVAQGIEPVVPDARFNHIFGRIPRPIITRRVAAQIHASGTLYLVPGKGKGGSPELWQLKDRTDLSKEDSMWTLEPSWSGMLSICSKTRKGYCLNDGPQSGGVPKDLHWVALWMISKIEASPSGASTLPQFLIESHSRLWLSAKRASGTRNPSLRLDNGLDEMWTMKFYNANTLKALKASSVVTG